MNKTNIKFVWHLVFLFFLFQGKTFAADSNQIHINDTFKVQSSKYTEMLKTIITDVEVSQDSGTVNGTFYIQVVKNYSFLTQNNALIYLKE